MSKEVFQRRWAYLMELKRAVDKGRAKKQFYDFAMRQFMNEVRALCEDMFEDAHGKRPSRRKVQYAS